MHAPSLYQFVIRVGQGFAGLEGPALHLASVQSGMQEGLPTKPKNLVLLDDLVGAGEQRKRHREAEPLNGIRNQERDRHPICPKCSDDEESSSWRR